MICGSREGEQRAEGEVQMGEKENNEYRLTNIEL
jgi:hypothetical protein